MRPCKASALLSSVCLHSAALAFAFNLPVIPAGSPDGLPLNAFFEAASGVGEAPSEALDFPAAPAMPNLEMESGAPAEMQIQASPITLSTPGAGLLPAPPQLAGMKKKRGATAGGVGSKGNGGNYQAPAYLFHPAPAYPKDALHARIQGTVLLVVELTASGKPSSVKIVRSSGHPQLDQAALQAVQGWTFQPALMAGHPVNAQVEVPVRFAL